MRVDKRRAQDPEDLQKSPSCHEGLHRALLVDAASALVLPLQHTGLSQSLCLLSETILSCIFEFGSPSRVRSIVCKSSNQHAQIYLISQLVEWL